MEKSLIVLGAGAIGTRVARDILPGMSKKFSNIYFFDNDIKKQGKEFEGYQVLTDTEFQKLIADECALIIATDYWKEIFGDCKDYGVEKKIIAVYDKNSFNDISHMQSSELGGVMELCDIYTVKRLNDIELTISRIKENILALWDNAEEMILNFSSISITNTDVVKSKLSDLEMQEHCLSLDEAMKELEYQAPKAFKIWKELFENGEKSYLEDTSNNLSVPESRWAKSFDVFMKLNITTRGWLLDIGCGPQEVPSYLRNYPVERIVGMDPLMPVKEHPFKFVQGIAEFIPFKDNSFDYVTAVTSLDHVLLLDKALQEIYRVLKNDGKLLLWIGVVEESEEYDPYSETVSAADTYHMFHFHPSWFEPLMDKYLFMKESHYQDRWDNHFYAYRK